ncbi:unnamed protein product [marine sediment metagenome]|uniref:Uncharacterized protein n=1 Tax=marine sediment metagenome TaxID=412755 RepID=X0UUH7_9ZZZZ
MLTSERYKEVVLANAGTSWQLEIDPINLGILHGAMRLMLSHPHITKYSQGFKLPAEHIRNWCLTRFREMGFTEAEVQEMDKYNF